MEKTWQSTTLGDLPQIADELIESFKNERVFLFVGKMGAGKTTFIKSLCNQLGVQGEVSSPTFSLVNEYATKGGNPIFHFDFYRLETVTEAFDMGFEEYLESGNVCLIEWPDRVDEMLPEEFVLIQINAENGQRKIKATKVG